MKIEDLEKTLTGRTVVKVETRDKDYKLVLVLDDGTRFTVYAHNWLGGSCIGYDAVPPAAGAGAGGAGMKR